MKNYKSFSVNMITSRKFNNFIQMSFVDKSNNFFLKDMNHDESLSKTS